MLACLWKPEDSSCILCSIGHPAKFRLLGCSVSSLVWLPERPLKCLSDWPLKFHAGVEAGRHGFFGGTHD